MLSFELAPACVTVAVVQRNGGHETAGLSAFSSRPGPQSARRIAYEPCELLNPGPTQPFKDLRLELLAKQTRSLLPCQPIPPVFGG